MKPGAGAAEKLSQAADADHMDQRAWQRENQIRGGIKSTGGRRSPVLFAEYLFRILLASAGYFRDRGTECVWKLQVTENGVNHIKYT